MSEGGRRNSKRGRKARDMSSDVERYRRSRFMSKHSGTHSDRSGPNSMKGNRNAQRLSHSKRIRKPNSNNGERIPDFVPNRKS